MRELQRQGLQDSDEFHTNNQEYCELAEGQVRTIRTMLKRCLGLSDQEIIDMSFVDAGLLSNKLMDEAFECVKGLAR